jgi:predicted phosphodiesterase
VTAFKHALVYGDSHYPFHDQGAINIIKKIAVDVKPDVVVHVGDLADAWQISRFDKDPARRESLQDDIDTACAHLKEMAMVTPQAKRYFLEGNHEFRLTKVIWRMSEEQRELARLRVFQKHVDWQGILAENGVPKALWDFVPARGQARRRIFPKLVVKHGSIVRKWSGATARGEWERYGTSGVSGHTHRLGLFYHRDFNGNQGWAETGCTCDLNPEYVEDPDWQHGCLIVTFARDYKYYSFEPVYIQEGRAIWRDNRYTP